MPKRVAWFCTRCAWYEEAWADGRALGRRQHPRGSALGCAAALADDLPLVLAGLAVWPVSTLGMYRLLGVAAA